MAVAQAMPMPTFVARCLEEIGLEGRCGLPVRDMFKLVDDAGDVVYRQYAWKVLRAMGDQVKFHYMLRCQDVQKETAASASTSNNLEWRSATSDITITETPSGRREKRRRKWSTTLLPVDEGKTTKMSDGEGDSEGTTNGRQRKMRRRRRTEDGSAREAVAMAVCLLEPPSEDAEEKAANKQDDNIEMQDPHSMRLESSEHSQRSRSPRSRSSSPSRSRSSSGPSSSSSSSSSGGGYARSQSLDENTTTAAAAAAVRPEPVEMDERSQFLARSPRGYDLGEELDVTGLSYEDAMEETPEGVLGIVACEELRLKYLGVVDPSGVDMSSPQFDLLEMIGRAREQGLNAAIVAESRLFGDSRKLHYLLDLLIASNIVAKNIVSSDQKRFNILHLTRFASQFHPSMVSPNATFERDSFPKEQLPQMIARILSARGERTCVFADIGRELGFGKRHQEKLRKYFFQQMHTDAAFPLELFMARCNTGSDTKGRKLWCVRLRSSGRAIKGQSLGGADGSGPVIERGIMEQMFASIQDRQDDGATIPELRDVLGVPTFKLPYKLAQGLISNYSLGVEQVVLGKSTMYRMFAPGVVKPEHELPEVETALDQAVDAENDAAGVDELAGVMATKETATDGEGDPSGETIYQPSTLKEATRGLVMASTFERRRQYILKRVTAEKIVSVHQLRTGLIEIERPAGKPVADVGLIDIRSVRRIIDELEAAKAIVTVDITLPPKRVLQKSHKIVKCAALPGAQRDRDALRTFIDGYLEDQQRKFLENLDHDNDAFIVVSNRFNKKMAAAKTDEAKSALLKESADKEIVKYTAASYKLARVHLVSLHKQGRRLGMHFGILYRCKAFHLLMWDRVPSLYKHRQDNVDIVQADKGDASVSTAKQPSVPQQKEMVFALKEILDLLTVREYIQLVGVSEVLSETEENKVRMAIARGDSWEALATEIQDKIRGCEADRFTRVLRVLIELGLVQIVNDSSHDLLRVMRRSTEDFDQVISQVAFATLSGGLFVLQQKARITIKRGNKILKQLPNKQSYVYAAGYSGGSDESEQSTGRIPLEFTLVDVDAAKEYWKALKFLCVEGARLGSGGQDSRSGKMNVDAELVRPAPLRDHNMYAIKVWVPRATTNYSAITERAKAVADAVGQDQTEEEALHKRKRYQPQSTRVSGPRRAEKVQRQALDQIFSSVYKDVEAEEEDVAGSTGSRWRQQDGWGGAKSRSRAAKWSSEEDVLLIEMYIEKLSHQWFIDVPLALQRRDERVAFRTPALSRTKISWKAIANRLHRKREDCMVRVRELLTVPAILARVEKTKQAITRAKNPSGEFHEELAILKQPKLTALLSRALQIIFHEQTSYYSVLADMLLSSHWKEAEVKLVWRYLWLASVIARTKGSDDKNQRQRGFCIHSHVNEMKSLQIAQYSIEFFCDAAEYASFLQQNIKEAEMVDEEDKRDDDDTNPETTFEQEIETNTPGAQVSIDLSAMVTSSALYTPTFVPPLRDAKRVPVTAKTSPTLQESKRSLAIKGFAGHLSKRFDGASVDDFLKDFWGVTARYGSHLTADGREARRADDALELTSTQAFSTTPPKSRRRVVSLQTSDAAESTAKAAEWLAATLEGAGRNGLSAAELATRFEKEISFELSSVGHEMLLERALTTALAKRLCFEVNGSDAIRLVAASHAAMWTLKPYRISSDSTKDKVHFVFDQERPVVSHPWLHLDGSVNPKVAMMLKRRLVNIVMCSPGIPDRLVHQKMNRALTLQDTRLLLDQLVEEEIVYARVGQRCSVGDLSTPRGSIFDVATHKPTQMALFAWTPGHLRTIDNACDTLFYFPTVNCVELLGAAACDVDLGRNE